MTDWPSYNRSLIRRGEILFSYDFLDIWDDDLARMNDNKKGKKYKFPDSFILIIGYIRVYFHLPYRQTSSIPKRKKRNKGGLSQEGKDYNKSHSKRRIVIEHAICRLKKYWILADVFRNRLRKYDKV